MLPFTIDIRPGEPVQTQVVLAVQRAIASARLRPGDRFPSVRKLGQELRINPNTAHKIVAALVADGLLEVRPGIGTVVCAPREADDADRRRLLETDLERLVVRARSLGIDRDRMVEAVDTHFARLAPPDSKPAPEETP